MFHTMVEHQREENRENTCSVLPTENMMHPIEKINKQYDSVQDQIYISVQPPPKTNK